MAGVVMVGDAGELVDARGEKPCGPVRGGGFSFGPDRRISYAVGPRKMSTLEELEVRLRQLHKAADERPATIDSRPGTVYADVIGVLDATLNAGFTQITFVGAYED